MNQETTRKARSERGMTATHKDDGLKGERPKICGGGGNRG